MWVGVLSPRLKVNVLLVSPVPVPHLVKIYIAHVISSYFTNLLPVLLNVTVEVVLRPHSVGAQLKVGVYAVFIISEFELSGVLVTHGTHEDVPKVVADPAVLDLLAVLEEHGPPPDAVDRRRVGVGLDVEGEGAVASVVVVGTLDDVVRPWRVVTCLLKYDR